MLSFFQKSDGHPDGPAAMRRAAILKHIFVKALATPPAEALAEWMKSWTEEDRRNFIAGFFTQFTAQEKQLRASGLWDSMASDEREFIQTGILETTEQQRIDASWLAEPFMCLVWALREIDQLPPYDQEANPDLMKSHLAKSLNQIMKGAKLRPRADIERQRAWAELWHWRCRTRMLLESGKIPAVLENGTSMNEVIGKAAKLAAAQGAFNSPIDDDFPAYGKPFRSTSAEEFTHITSISRERHRAFNWLCGYAPENRWEETPTDT